MRASAAHGLVEESLFRETLALLLVCEHNLGQSQDLRIAHVRRVEPEHLGTAVADARRSLENDREADQLLVEMITEVIGTLSEPTR